MGLRHSLSFLQGTFDRTLRFSAGAIGRAKEIQALLASDHLDDATRAELAIELHDQKRILHKFAIKVAAKRVQKKIEAPNPHEREN